ncbi:MAG: hypothetical protein ABSA75_14525 [Candidatus Bathyarchaeia archaeon]
MKKVAKKFGLLGFVTIFVVVLFSLSSLFALAQYQTQQTTNITISSTGAVHVAQSDTVGGVSIDITGTPGATGSVSTATYTGNPQAGASWPSGVTLTHFIVITFNIAANDFQSATITITYSSADVAGIKTPYTLYKYDSATNSYNALNTVVDTSTKTITATVTSINDPLLAIGGATAPAPTTGIPAWTWVVLAVVALVIVLLAVLLLRRRSTVETLPS